MPGVSVNENAISANVWKLVVEIDSACIDGRGEQSDDAADQPQQQRFAEKRSEDRTA